MTQTVLVVAAHPDDEVLGCGGAMLRHVHSGDRVVCLILAEGLTGRHRNRSDALHEWQSELRTLHTEARKCAGELGIARLEIGELPDNRLDEVPLLDVVKRIEEIYYAERPSTVYTHHPGDVNVDHRVAYHAVLAACRQLPESPLRSLYLFEVPSSTEWQSPATNCPFTPNHFVDISDYLEPKLRALAMYRSEERQWPHPRSLRAVRALAEWRGAISGVGAAEAFVVGRQLVTDVTDL